MSLAVDDAVRPALEDAPPSAVTVWLILQEAQTPMSSQDIAIASTLPRATVKEGLKRLRKLNLVEMRTVPEPNRPRYTPQTG